jgi:hypothetical protein
LVKQGDPQIMQWPAQRILYLGARPDGLRAGFWV